MKIELEIPEDMLLKEIVDRIATEAIHHLLEPAHVKWDARQNHKRQKLQQIVDTINWKDAGSYLSEVIVKKFFEKQLGENVFK